MLHTKTKWRVVDELNIVGGDGYVIGGIADASEAEGGRPVEDRANAKRIVDAVNAVARFHRPGDVAILLRLAAKMSAELHRLHRVHIYQFDGKVGQPDLKAATRFDAAIAAATEKRGQRSR